MTIKEEYPPIYLTHYALQHVKVATRSDYTSPKDIKNNYLK